MHSRGSTYGMFSNTPRARRPLPDKGDDDGDTPIFTSTGLSPQWLVALHLHSWTPTSMVSAAQYKYWWRYISRNPNVPKPNTENYSARGSEPLNKEGRPYRSQPWLTSPTTEVGGILINEPTQHARYRYRPHAVSTYPIRNMFVWYVHTGCNDTMVG